MQMAESSKSSKIEDAGNEEFRLTEVYLTHVLDIYTAEANDIGAVYCPESHCSSDR